MKKGVLGIASICVSILAIIVLGILLYSTARKFEQVQTELGSTQETLQTAENESLNLQKALAETQSKLEATRVELSQTQKILQNASEATRKIATERNALQ